MIAVNCRVCSTDVPLREILTYKRCENCWAAVQCFRRAGGQPTRQERDYSKVGKRREKTDVAR